MVTSPTLTAQGERGCFSAYLLLQRAVSWEEPYIEVITKGPDFQCPCPLAPFRKKVNLVSASHLRAVLRARQEGMGLAALRLWH